MVMAVTSALIQTTPPALPLTPRRGRGRPPRAYLQDTPPVRTPVGAVVKGVHYVRTQHLDPRRYQRLLELKIEPIEHVTVQQLMVYTRDQLRGYGFAYGFPRLTKPEMLGLLFAAVEFFHPGDPMYKQSKYAEVLKNIKGLEKNAQLYQEDDGDVIVIDDDDHKDGEEIPMIPSSPRLPQIKEEPPAMLRPLKTEPVTESGCTTVTSSVTRSGSLTSDPASETSIPQRRYGPGTITDDSNFRAKRPWTTE